MSSQETQPVPKRKFIRLPHVIESTGLSRSGIYRKIAAAEFPRPVRLGPKSVAWIESEVQEWMADLVSHCASSGMKVFAYELDRGSRPPLHHHSARLHVF